MLTSDQVVLREGAPRALDELRGVLAEAGVVAHITKSSGCKPNG